MFVSPVLQGCSWARRMYSLRMSTNAMARAFGLGSPGVFRVPNSFAPYGTLRIDPSTAMTR